jgi:octaheme c-type cytochrome (tetrathionate reductase family)
MNFGMLCQDCHTTDRHQMAGKSLAVFATKGNRVYCTDCHDQDRHQSKTIANHTKKVACQTCHIPYYAKGQPTKLYWDWSVAGENRTAEKDAYGMPVYAKKKGAFVWGQHVQPAYYWYNGTTERYLKGDKIDPSQTVHLNKPLGNTDEDGARIYPFKVMQGKQIYDIHNQYLIIPQLFGGYWKHFDWGKAAESGMKIAGLPYSGEYGFVKTQMYWGLDHMVSPKEDALKCNDCHGRGRRLDWKGLGYAGDPWQDK